MIMFGIMYQDVLATMCLTFFNKSLIICSVTMTRNSDDSAEGLVFDQ